MANDDIELGVRAYESLLSRIRALPLSTEELGLSGMLTLFGLSIENRSPDRPLFEILSHRVSQFESFNDEARPIPPRHDPSIETGDFYLADIVDDGSGSREQRMSFNPDHPNPVNQIVIYGESFSGKSAAVASLASEFPGKMNCVIFDRNRSYRRMRSLWKSFDFVHASDLRLNLFGADDEIESELIDLTLIEALRDSFFIELGTLEILEVCKEIRASGSTPNWPLILDTLRNKSFPRQTGYARLRYRDTAVMTIDAMLRATGATFRCSRGMNPTELFANCLVIEIHGIPPQHQRFLIRSLFNYFFLVNSSKRSAERPEKKQVWVLEDVQPLFVGDESFAEKAIEFRHAGIHLVTVLHNPSLVSPALRGQADCIVAMRTMDQRDIDALRDVLGLSKEVASRLRTLENRECFIRLTRSNVKHVIHGRIREISYGDAEQFLEEKTRRFLSRFSWEALKCESMGSSMSPGNFEKKESNEDAAMRFLRFLATGRTEEQEYGSSTVNHEAAGIRGREKRIAVEKILKCQGLIRTYPLAVNPRGRPITLLEPTEKAFEALVLEKARKKGPGGLDARASVWYLMRILEAVEGVEVFKEGSLRRVDGEKKQVDLLMRWLTEEAWSCEIAAGAGHEATNALFCLGCSDIERHVVVCTTKKVKEAVLRSFAKHEELREDRRIRVLVLWEALKPEAWRR